MLDIRLWHVRAGPSVDVMTSHPAASATAALPRVAFLGLGLMGTPMAHRLLDAGLPLTVWNRTAARAEPFAARGATAAATAAGAVEGADVVVMMLADPAAVASVVGEIAGALRPGTVLVDTSSIGPDAARAAAARLPRGVAYVDAPVMGSVDRAAAGELLILAGGETRPVLPVLAHLGKVRECGGVGSGAALKLVLINAVIGGVVLTAEAMALGRALGLDDGLVTDGLAASPLGPLLQRVLTTTAHFPLEHAAKDVRLAAAAADLPLARTVLERLTSHPGPAGADLARIADLPAGEAVRG
ncbi:3-hydroxyisobutyrate dehydrogenase [Actinacidiphila cocklensis]|uniref:3-hydroxyisobutyrate dehydrogenase n=2 Tax=Actinacidiphila cocklensis TaxID=887465 RepID=A0A9W4DRP7_9ACTN|nr:3-hydroxyisobutyrate dehydrogenase [Actinacidiphila cocklensis]